MHMRLVLFDIDGTLLQTGGLGQGSAGLALKEIFGTAGRIDHFYPGGRTIEGIFRDTLADAGCQPAEYDQKRDLLYSTFLEIFEQRLTAGKHRIQALPGALQLVKTLTGASDICLGLVTGNHARTAELKLETAGFDPDTFPVGAFGDQTADRSRLVPRARKRAEDFLDRKIPAEQVLVVGDTTRDVLAARAAGAVSLAVLSGTDTRQQLEAVSPDYLLDGLGDNRSILEIIDSLESKG